MLCYMYCILVCGDECTSVLYCVYIHIIMKVLKVCTCVHVRSPIMRINCSFSHV